MTKTPAALARQSRRREARIEAIRTRATARGMTRRQIAADLGLSYGYICAIVAANALSVPHFDQSNPERNQEFLRRRNAGETLETIAKDYGITRERVRQICDKLGARSGEDIVASRRVHWSCAWCKQTEILAPKKAAKRKSMHRRCDFISRGEVIAKRRLAGEAWTDIAVSLGHKYPTDFSDEARWAALYLDWCGAPADIRARVFPGNGRTNDPERRRSRMRAAVERRRASTHEAAA